MSNEQNQWVIRLDSEQVKGPYSTETVTKMILSGVFSGNEEICAYPEGEWNALTKQPEFYDALLESLENPVEVDKKKSQKMDAETVVQPQVMAPKKNTSTLNNKVKASNEEDLKRDNEINFKNEDVLKHIADREKELKTSQNKEPQLLKEMMPQRRSLIKAKMNLPSLPFPLKKKKSLIQERDENLILHMSDIKKLQTQEKKKFFPFILFLFVLCAVAFYFLDFNESDYKHGWTLLAPVKKSSSVNDEDILAIKKRMVRAFQFQNIETIYQTHKDIVQAVESKPKDLELLGLLCLAYNEIWPYTKQTSDDLRSILTVTQMARSVNPISNYSETCQIIYLLDKGQNKEARSLLEKTLDNQVEEKFSLAPFLYLLKAQMLEYEINYNNALAYYDSASQLWPQWIMSQFGSARVNFKLNKYNEAFNLYQQILKIDKESKIGLFGLGLVYSVGLNNKEKAYEFFSLGYKSNQKILKDFHVEALIQFAKILIEKNDNKKALAVAQKGYQLNPSHKELKGIVITLGGDDRIENSQSEIVLQGDQFARAGDHLAAQAQYKAAFDLDPKNASAAYKAAKSLWAINQTKDAITWLGKAIQADPKLIQAYTLKADYEAQKYDFLEAAKTLQSANRQVEQSHEVLKGQALLEFRKNNMTAAIQFGERAMKIYDADSELLSILAQANIHYYVNAVGSKKEDIQRKENAIKDAQRYAGKAIDLEPSWPEAQITYSKFLGVKDGPLRGEKYLKELIKNFPYTTEYRLALAEYYFSSEKYYEASETYLQIFNLDSKNKKASFGLAECYRIMNKPDMAQRYYNVASLLDPSDVEPLVANAKLLLETAYGKEAKPKILQAIAKLKVVREINPSFPKVSYLMAKCYMELGDFQQALDFIKEEKTRNPGLADPFLLAAEIFYRKEQYTECATEYSQAIKMRPSSAELYVKASTCYRKSEVLDIAEDLLSIALNKESGYAEIYREYGFIYEKKGFPTEAKKFFEKYLELAPNAPDKAMIELKLR